MTQHEHQQQVQLTGSLEDALQTIVARASCPATALCNRTQLASSACWVIHATRRVEALLRPEIVTGEVSSRWADVECGTTHTSNNALILWSPRLGASDSKITVMVVAHKPNISFVDGCRCCVCLGIRYSPTTGVSSRPPTTSTLSD